jgi:hypothetical protein
MVLKLAEPRPLDAISQETQYRKPTPPLNMQLIKISLVLAAFSGFAVAKPVELSNTVEGNSPFQVQGMNLM